jgi:histidinol-phosphate aminotransferase
VKFSIDPSIQRISHYPKAALYGADAGRILLSSNENPFPPSPRVVEGIVNALFDINRYPESESELKALLARKHGLKPQNIVIGNGSNEIIEATLRTVRLAGRTKVIVPEPSFAFYPIASNVYGYVPESVPLDDLRINLDRMRERIDDKTRVVFLCNPNNPTGTIFEDDAFRTFLKSLPPEILVVVDEAYAEFSDNPRFPQSIGCVNDYPVLVMKTFSKAYGLAGLRIGYGVGEESLVSFIERTKQPFSVNMMALIAAKAALADEGHLSKVLDNNRNEKAYFYDCFKALRLAFLPTEANFVLVKIGPDAKAVASQLFDKKIVVRWLGGYGLTDYIRITVGTPHENKAFIEALKRVI